MINVIPSCLWPPGFKRDSCPWKSREKPQVESCLSSSAAPPCVSSMSLETSLAAAGENQRVFWETASVDLPAQLCSCSPHTLPLFFINAVSCTYLWSYFPDSSLRYVPEGCCRFSYWEYTVIVLPPSAFPSSSSTTLHLLPEIHFLMFHYVLLSLWLRLHTPSLLSAGHHSSHDPAGSPASNTDVIFQPIGLIQALLVSEFTAPGFLWRGLSKGKDCTISLQCHKALQIFLIWRDTMEQTSTVGHRSMLLN